VRNRNFPQNIALALTESFQDTDQEFLKLGLASGTTATVLLVVGNEIYIANAGDSSAILAERTPVSENSAETKLVATKVTADHRASNEDEKKRIKDQGGLVLWYNGSWRVNGVMAVSRSIGDASMANVVIAEPSIYSKTLSSNDEYVILATDGLWDVMTPNEVTDFIAAWRAVNAEKEDSGNLSFELTQEAQRRNASDDITVVVAFLQAKGVGFRKDRSEIVASPPEEDDEDF
jgi:serine/threonine protein phosphatase PrpC